MACECTHEISGRAGFHKWVSMRALPDDLVWLPLLGQVLEAWSVACELKMQV